MIKCIDVLLPLRHNVNLELLPVNSNVSKNYLEKKIN